MSGPNCGACVLMSNASSRSMPADRIPFAIADTPSPNPTIQTLIIQLSTLKSQGSSSRLNAHDRILNRVIRELSIQRCELFVVDQTAPLPDHDRGDAISHEIGDRHRLTHESMDAEN